jgi:hypothetical protein
VQGTLYPDVVESGPDWQPWCKFFGVGACPLFWSPVTDAAGHQSTVLGTENAESGQLYTFHCVVHPQITATLLVV